MAEEASCFLFLSVSVLYSQKCQVFFSSLIGDIFSIVRLSCLVIDFTTACNISLPFHNHLLGVREWVLPFWNPLANCGWLMPLYECWVMKACVSTHTMPVCPIPQIWFDFLSIENLYKIGSRFGCKFSKLTVLYSRVSAWDPTNTTGDQRWWTYLDSTFHPISWGWRFQLQVASLLTTHVVILLHWISMVRVRICDNVEVLVVQLWPLAWMCRLQFSA